MTRKGYTFFIAITLVGFAFALAWPEFFIRAYSGFATVDEVASIDSPEGYTPDTDALKVRLRKLDTTDEAHNVAQIERDAALAMEVSDNDRVTTKLSTLDLGYINFDIPIIDEPAEPAPNIIEGEKPPLPTVNTATINRLIIPRMGVDSEIIISESQSALNKGLWHIPGSALPGQDGNIVISAHRWLHKPPSDKTFYLIDKLQDGDPIYYDYYGKRYEYKVQKSFIVEPDQVEILRQDENKLTLFTCTPLYSTTHRYVVNAELISVSNI